METLKSKTIRCIVARWKLFSTTGLSCVQYKEYEKRRQVI